MAKSAFLIIGISVCPLGAALMLSAQTTATSPTKDQDQPLIKYAAEDGLPKDKAGEKRRDYVVLEATLNDLASPKNPEYKYHIQNVGPGKEIVVNNKTCMANQFTDIFFDLVRPNSNIDGHDIQSIPVDIQEDFKRRSKKAASSLADFKPVNTNIIVQNLDHMLEKPQGVLDDSLNAIRRKYPTAWGYVRAYPPAYSKDGISGGCRF